MSEDTAVCKSCPARFPGEGGAKDLKTHVEAFHPAGAPTPTATVLTPGTTVVEGADLAPAVSDIAQGLGDVKGTLGDLHERVSAIEDVRLSDTDLDKLAELVAARLAQTPGTVVNITTPATPEPEATGTDDEKSYRDLQTEAKDLGIPATGTSEALAEAIAAERERLAKEASASSSGS